MISEHPRLDDYKMPSTGGPVQVHAPPMNRFIPEVRLVFNWKKLVEVSLPSLCQEKPCT